MPYIPIPPPIRRADMGDSKESMGILTDEKRKYLKELGKWLATYGDGDEWTLDYGIIRDKVFFTDLIRKVEVIGSYSPIDRSWLKMITKVHNEWIRDDNHKRNT